jgi:lysophospholipase L1-like esterase
MAKFAWTAIVAAGLACLGPAADARAQLACPAFTQEALPQPTPRRYAAAVARWSEINAAVRSTPYRILFLGDSLTERWDPEIWQHDYAARGALNAGVGGDLTEHLMWRLEHGNLDGPPPRLVVLLIGTNDLGEDRSPQETAEGVRRILATLRGHWPQTRILLLGLWPRGLSPEGKLREPIAETNRLIRSCADGSAIVYLDLGPLLLDPDGRLLPAVSPDRLHLSALGYRLIAPRLDAAIDRLLRGD